MVYIRYEIKLSSLLHNIYNFFIHNKPDIHACLVFALLKPAEKKQNPQHNACVRYFKTPSIEKKNNFNHFFKKY